MDLKLKVADVIFDFGSNKGQNLKYFLSRAARVVAVEANPRLCSDLNSTFAEEIASGNLFVENVVLDSRVPASKDSNIEFYVHKHNDLLSGILPRQSDRMSYEIVEVARSTPSSLVRKYVGRGYSPKYVKMDLEGYDSQALQNLFCNGIFPLYISCENQSIGPISTLLSNNLYQGFKIVEGNSVGRLSYSNGCNLENFPDHSSGPFGEDIPGPWYTPISFFTFISLKGFGWYDVHATRLSSVATIRIRKRHLIKAGLSKLRHHVLLLANTK